MHKLDDTHQHLLPDLECHLEVQSQAKTKVNRKVKYDQRVATALDRGSSKEADLPAK